MLAVADLDSSRASPSASPHGRRGFWALPAAASVLFVICVVALAQYRLTQEQDERQRTLISDALSVEVQLHTRLEIERAHTRALAAQLYKTPPTDAALAASPEVAEGLQRLWLSVTWLDANNRIVAQVPDKPLSSLLSVMELNSGISSHLSAAYSEAPDPSDGTPLKAPRPAGKVVVRYAPAVLLKSAAPWWLAHKYEVQLVDISDQVIASTGDGAVRSGSSQYASYRLSVDGDIPGAYLELTTRERSPGLWSPLPVALVAGFLLLMGVATVLLRRQVQRISRAETAWRTEVAWRSAMQDSALVGLRARDSAGCLLYVNRTFCEMVGIPAERLIGLKPPMPYWPPDTLEEVMMRNQRNLAGQAPREGYEAIWCRQDGSRLNVMVFESPLIDAGGRQVGWMGSIMDITGKKQMEERDRQQAEVMANQAKLSTFGEVASSLAHQLNQPLTAIAGYNAGILQTLEGAGYDNALVLQALRRQGQQTREAGKIVQRIREFLTRRIPVREPFDLVATVRRVVGLLQRELTRLHIQVQWTLAPQLPEVFADQVLIEQLVINLIRNAADALTPAPDSPPDPGSVPGRIDIQILQASRRFVRVDIQDNGPGLDGRTMEQLAAPFYSTKANGMGMGLAICRSVVEAHNGALDAGAAARGGARFSFTLPIFVPSQEPV